MSAKKEGTYYSRNKEKCKEAAKQYQRDNPEYVLYKAAQHRASQKGVGFDLDIDYIRGLPKGPLCPVFGIPADEWHLDRKDNSKGYVKGNVFFISRRANVLKNDATEEELEKILAYMRS